MIKITKKLIAAALAAVFVFGPAITCFARGTAAVEPAKSQVSPHNIDDIASVLSVINVSIGEQARRIVELACLASNLSRQSGLPAVPTKNKSSSQCKSAYTIAAGNINVYKHNEDGRYGTLPGTAPAGAANKVIIIFSFAVWILLIGRLKTAVYFYLLPRCSIDDAALNANICKNALIGLKPMRFFYF